MQTEAYSVCRLVSFLKIPSGRLVIWSLDEATGQPPNLLQHCCSLRRLLQKYRAGHRSYAAHRLTRHSVHTGPVTHAAQLSDQSEQNSHALGMPHVQHSEQRLTGYAAWAGSQMCL